MLQAWANTCILLLALAILPAAECSAQRSDEEQETPGIQSIGEASVDTEYPLDLTIPLREEGVAAPPAGQAEGSFEREMAIEKHLTRV